MAETVCGYYFVFWIGDGSRGASGGADIQEQAASVSPTKLRHLVPPIAGSWVDATSVVQDVYNLSLDFVGWS